MSESDGTASAETDVPNDHATADLYDSLLFSIVHNFTHVELLLRRLLQHKAGLSRAYFDALFGIPQLSFMTARLIKLYKIDPHPEHQDTILSSLQQLGTMARLRNWMVHAGGHAVQGGKFLIHLNPNECSVATGASYHEFHPDEIVAAIGDIHAIIAALMIGLDVDVSLVAYLSHSQGWRFKLPGIEKV